jgi:hypothetical protein
LCKIEACSNSLFRATVCGQQPKDHAMFARRLDWLNHAWEENAAPDFEAGRPADVHGLLRSNQQAAMTELERAIRAQREAAIRPSRHFADAHRES